MKYKLETPMIKTSDCWLYLGPFHYSKYSIPYGTYGRKQAHRISYEIFNGEIPGGLTIDHLCKTPVCINPSHLEAVSISTNVLRGNGICAKNARKTICVRGHSLIPENLSKIIKTKRICLVCVRENSRHLYHKNLEKERKRSREYRKNNLERECERKRIYRERMGIRTRPIGPKSKKWRFMTHPKGEAR